MKCHMGVDGAAPERCVCVCVCVCVSVSVCVTCACVCVCACECVGGPAFCTVHVLNVSVMCKYLV